MPLFVMSFLLLLPVLGAPLGENKKMFLVVISLFIFFGDSSSFPQLSRRPLIYFTVGVDVVLCGG